MFGDDGWFPAKPTDSAGKQSPAHLRGGDSAKSLPFNQARRGFYEAEHTDLQDGTYVLQRRPRAKNLFFYCRVCFVFFFLLSLIFQLDREGHRLSPATGGVISWKSFNRLTSQPASQHGLWLRGPGLLQWIFIKVKPERGVLWLGGQTVHDPGDPGDPARGICKVPAGGEGGEPTEVTVHQEDSSPSPRCPSPVSQHALVPARAELAEVSTGGVAEAGG
ncbi:unnamed protein product [Pleuronectes platessa]|uniref:Uncharacterized protein n=1 Tax=Pleuronectes platessa TaxID=8262 RepID=A0A9N7UYX4_PLEPL|nr:unnamed protein product [Pleuronectes platessa]